MRGIPAREFTLAQFLPGRDFACQSLWRDGQLVLIKTFERLSYVVRGSAASSVSSLASLMKMVYEPRVVEVCTAAIRQLDRRASGVFCIDLKESSDGTPCVTEINAGRFSMSTNVYDLTGRYNMALAYVQLARKTCEVPPETYDVVEDHYMVRDLDGPPRVLTADALFDGILDATGEATCSAGDCRSPKRRRTSHGRLQSAHA
jgi:carbamoyl-phosphate synthase large subunit